MNENQQPNQPPSTKTIFSRTLSAMGAFGVALQNYPAVDLFMRDLFKSILLSGKLSKYLGQGIALSAGGICSGVVNFWMNIDLLDGFFERLHTGFRLDRLKLNPWQKMQYFAGILVFVVTGLLFGLMAFTFAMQGPLATLSIIAGVLVAGIMTIQEVETWLSSYDNPHSKTKESLNWLQATGKWCGHFIAAGNVIALSLLFTLGLTQSLMLLNVAALPALITGLAIAFSFGAFTEYYFYNFYLADFGKNFQQKFKSMMEIKHAWFGLACVVTNALVNGALAYAGVALLPALLIAAHIALPPVAIITALAGISAFFAGSASLVLGVDFWIRQNAPKKAEQAVTKKVTGLSQFGMFTPKNLTHQLENSVESTLEQTPSIAA